MPPSQTNVASGWVVDTISWATRTNRSGPLRGCADATSAESIVIVVSHREALLRRCNRFLVLEHGRVVAQGDAAAVDLAGRIGQP